MSVRRLGIFGGTFDPIHIGHLYIANAVLTQERLDQVLFLPVGEPGHRSTHASGADRKAMVEIAIRDNPGFALDDTALLQPAPVYTADSMPLLRQRYPAASLCFIAGTDALVRSRWRRLDEVLEALERFYVVARDQAATDELLPLLAELPQHLARRFTTLKLPLVDISASSIRQDIAAERSIRYLVPDAVGRFIKERKLYQS